MLTLKKSLGQHFLRDEEVCRRIVDLIAERPLHRLVEVGPGGGALTKFLLKLPGVDFKVVEIDQEKVQYLAEQLPAIQGKIIHGDILRITRPFDETFTLVGNFPYNISTEIVFRVLEWKDAVNRMVGMFQKEVAQRLAAREGSKVYGVTSVLIQAFFSVDYHFEVSEEAFNPPPKVKSAVISMTPLSEPVPMKSQRAFTNLVKTAFGQRRKTLRNAVRSLFDAEVLEEAIFNQRAEQLSVAEFAALSFRMK